ncbi:MAG TPA: hypothetical protein VHM90_01760, partial [Phycisphaerae bacterium]|nr:hypothetical protein [Phycisphaerae bacterium]
SFSDAHELREIPIIAANLQQLVLPRQCQVWAVLRAADSDQRLCYSLAACFLGRMCLSGEIDRLSGSQTALVSRAIELYRQAAPVIRGGVSQRLGPVGESWRHPTGWQAVVRKLAGNALAVVHAFAGASHKVALPMEGWRVVEQFGVPSGAGLEFELAPFSAAVMLLERSR